MKLVSLFDDFLKDTVNLNQTRIDLLDDSIAALKTFVPDSEWKPRIRGFEEQGSWAHGTIIRPVEGGEFDADLLVMVDPVEGWTAADYVEELGRVFADSGTYADKTKVWDYCVTITYAGQRRIDLAPCVVGRRWEGQIEVCNRKGDFERSEPVASFDILGGQAAAFKFLNALQIFKLAVSLGGTESLASLPASMTHSGVPADVRHKMGILDSTIRLSIGIEHPSDLIADIDQALSVD